MAKIFSRRKPIKHQLWMALILATVIGCSAFVYGSLCYGGHYLSETWEKRKISAAKGRLSDEKCIPVCDSEECVQESNLLLNQVNPHVDPCENFFEFACGKYLEKFGKNESNILQTRMKEQMRLRVKDILEDIEPNMDTATGKVRVVYDTCIKRSSSDIKVITTVIQILSQLGIPQWPNLDPDFKLEEASFQNILSNFIHYKEYAFLDISEIFSFREMPGSEANASIEVRKGPYESKEASVRKYLVEKVLQYFDIDNENIIRIWNESESILSAILHLKQESENNGFQVTYLDCTLEDESEWKPVCKILKSFVNLLGENTGISNRFLNVRASNAYFVQNIFSVLKNFSHKSVADFLALNLFLNHLYDLNFYFRWLFRKDSTSFLAHRGIHVEIGHWQHCAEWLMQKFFIPLGHEYMKKFLTKSIVEELDDLIKKIISETAGEISHQTWISEVMRKAMTKRTEYQDHSVAMLKDVLSNDTFINDLFKEFHPANKSFIDNIFKYQRYSKLEEMKGTLRAMNLDWFDASLLTPEAVSGGGKIDLQFGILMPPIYHPKIERIINTITLSTIVAHEIGHVFQEFYYRFKRQDRKAKNFSDNVSACISDQYSQFKFKFTGKNVNGSRYARENVADLVAISIIDKFIEKYSNQNEVFSLPAFSYFTPQMLYISSVQMFCAANTQRDEEFNDKISSHSLPKFRVLGMMQNSKGFARAFNCSDGSFMNPTRKCAYFLDKTGKS